MVVLISLLILVIIVAVPVYLITSAWKKVDNEEKTPSADVIANKFQTGFLMSFWGLDLAFSVIPLTFAGSIWLVYTNKDSGFGMLIFALILTGIAGIGLILFCVGHTIVDLQIRRIVSIKGREATPLEEWTAKAMAGAIDISTGEYLLTQFAAKTNNKVDDVASIAIGAGIISRYIKVGKIHIGNKFLKNHWIWIVTILICIVFIVMTVIY